MNMNNEIILNDYQIASIMLSLAGLESRTEQIAKKDAIKLGGKRLINTLNKYNHN